MSDNEFILLYVFIMSMAMCFVVFIFYGLPLILFARENKERLNKRK